jgi:hypothetical protein
MLWYAIGFYAVIMVLSALALYCAFVQGKRAEASRRAEESAKVQHVTLLERSEG